MSEYVGRLLDKSRSKMEAANKYSSFESGRRIQAKCLWWVDYRLWQRKRSWVLSPTHRSKRSPTQMTKLEQIILLCTDRKILNQSHLVKAWLPGAQEEELGGSRCALSLCTAPARQIGSWTSHSCIMSVPL